MRIRIKIKCFWDSVLWSDEMESTNFGLMAFYKSAIIIVRYIKKRIWSEKLSIVTEMPWPGNEWYWQVAFH